MERYKVEAKAHVDLSKRDPGDRSAFSGGAKKAAAAMADMTVELQKLQELLYAERKHKILIVLQAMDTGGKDGAVRHVVGPLNPQGVRVASFKKPSQEEMDRDFLWRVHRQVPGKGEIVVFNRSHYEDVLVVRVHNLVPETLWTKRYRMINDFEQMLSDEGMTILKFFLHIDRDEQKARLQARIDDPTKQWKLSASDLPERELWDEYMAAYEDAMEKTSTQWAPWYVVPANNKWYRDLVIATVLSETLKGFDMHYPKPSVDVAALSLS